MVRQKALFLLGEMWLWPRFGQCEMDWENHCHLVQTGRETARTGDLRQGPYRPRWLPACTAVSEITFGNGRWSFGKVRMNVIWTSKNLVAKHPTLFANKRDMFVALLEDNVEYARMETPDIFRVLRKREPGIYRAYLERFQSLPEPDWNRVARVHTVGAAVLRKRQSKKAWRDRRAYQYEIRQWAWVRWAGNGGMAVKG